MSKKWSSYDKEKAYTDTWRTFLEENQITEEELDEGLEDILGRIGKAGDKAGKSLGSAAKTAKTRVGKLPTQARKSMEDWKNTRAAGKAADAAAKATDAGRADDPVAKRGETKSSIIMALGTVVGQKGTLRRHLDPRQMKVANNVLSRWAQENLGHKGGLAEALPGASDLFRGAVAPLPRSAVTRGGTAPPEREYASAVLDLKEILGALLAGGLTEDLARIVSAEVARVLEPLGVQVHGAEETTRVSVDTAAKLSLFLRTDRDFHNVIKKFSAPDAKVFYEFLQEAADMLDEPGNQPRGQVLTYWQNLMRTMQAFNKEYQSSKEDDTAQNPFRRVPTTRPAQHQPASTIGEAQMKKLENEILKEVQRVLHEKKRS